MADVGRSPPSPGSKRSPRKSPRTRRAQGSQRSPHHGRRKQPRIKATFDNESALPRDSRSPPSPLSPPMDSWSGSPESLSTPRAIEWPMRFLRFSGRVYPRPPSPVSPTRSAATESPTSPRQETVPSRIPYVAIVVVALVFTALVGTTFYAVRYSSRPPHAFVATECTTNSCSNYSKLLRDAMDEDQSPCDNFYKYVCGSWLDTHDPGDTVLGLAWNEFALTVASKFESVRAPLEMQESVQKAAVYLQACLSVLNKSNVGGVKQALEGGGIAWPRRNPKPDFLNAMFFMSQRVNMPVFIQLTIKEVKTTGYSLYFGEWPMFSGTMYRLAIMHKTRQLANHVEVLFKSFGGTDHSRLSELTKQLEGMVEFFNRYFNSAKKKTTYSNATAFLQFTPTVSLEKWNSLYKSYRGVTASGAQGVTIIGIEYFAAIFNLHKKYGDAVMNDIVESLAVENLIAFTEPRILESVYGNADAAKIALGKSCFAVSHSIFGYAINYFFLRSKSVPFDELKELAEDILEELPKLLSGNSSLLEGATNGSYFEAVFSILERSQPGVYLSAYTNYPDMTRDPLRNWMHVVEYGINDKKSRALEGRFISHDPGDNVNFKGFRIMMPALHFPVFTRDTHWSIRYGGLGARIVAAFVCDYIEASRKSKDVYRANQECLSGKLAKRINDNLQVAVASVGVILRLFEKARSKRREDDPLIMDLPHFKSEQLLFIFGCYMLCGEDGGEELCNTPVMHSVDFSRAFACPQDSPMNPSKKCWMLPP